MLNRKTIYHLEDVHRHYISNAEIVTAVNGISLKVFEGDFIVILGPSGSGKTTLLNLFAGLDKSTGGFIYFMNKNLSKLSDSELCELRRHNIGIIFQFYNMHPSFTAQENIEYPMLITGIQKERRKDRAIELLRKIELYDKKDNYPIELSGGEKQRIGIARALANDPEVIIADEPTGDLDSENTESIVNLLLDINRGGKTIVMVTHDESLLTPKMQIWRLIDGKIFRD